MKFKQCKATKDAQITLVTINNSTPGFDPSVPSLMIKFRPKKKTNLVDSQWSNFLINGRGK